MYKLNRSSKVVLTSILLMVFLIWGIRVQSLSTLPEKNLPLVDAENNGVNSEDAIEELQASLSENEADTFAGLWLEHTPEFKVIVLFTEDGEQKIKPYLTEELIDIVEVRDAKVSLAELENAQMELISFLFKDLGIPPGSEIDVYENNIKVYMNEADRRQFDAAVQGGLFDLPDYVEIITIPETGKNIEATSAPIPGIYFPQIMHTQGDMEALIKGELVLENGCLRVSEVDGVSILIIWDLRFSIRADQGVVQVIENRTGDVLASVGDFVAVGGGFDSDPTWMGLREPLSKDCPRPYYVIGESIKKIDKP